MIGMEVRFETAEEALQFIKQYVPEGKLLLNSVFEVVKQPPRGPGQVPNMRSFSWAYMEDTVLLRFTWSTTDVAEAEKFKKALADDTLVSVRLGAIWFPVLTKTVENKHAF